MAHITKIKASDKHSSDDDTPKKAHITRSTEKAVDLDKKNVETMASALKSEEKQGRHIVETSSPSMTKAERKAAKVKLKAEKKALKKAKRAEKKASRKPMPKWLKTLTAPFRFIAKPFAALGRYIRNSWIEIRQVSWPNRKATWKLTGAVLVYSAIFALIIVLLDVLFEFVFDLILGN